VSGATWPRERRIAIVGAGAIGCRIAAHFAQHGIAATLFDGWREHVTALRRDGLVLEQADGRTERFAATAFGYDDPQAPADFDVVLLAVRSDDTQGVLPLVRRLLKDDGCVVSCQNGLNEDAIAAAVGAQRTLGCSLIFGAKLVAPGRVKILPGADVLRTGELAGGDSARLQQLVALLGTCGTSTATFNLLGYRWMKLLLNATGNTLLLLTGLDAKGLHDREDARSVIIGMAREILGTARAAGIEPEPVLDLPTDVWLAPGAERDPRLHDVLRAHGEGLGSRRLSMVADFEARGRTEVDHINGYIAAKAAALGRQAPLNARVWRFVQEMEEGKRVAGVQVLDELAAPAAAA
jgi:2-dehydropantoate 2-reductase